MPIYRMDGEAIICNQSWGSLTDPLLNKAIAISSIFSRLI
jgi:hypothetical protein